MTVRQLAGAVALTAALTSCSGGSQEINGTLRLIGTDTWHNMPDSTGARTLCEGEGGYDDIHEGAQVTVRDGAGEILAVGSLQAGQLSAIDCEFAFTVSDVPGGKPIYSVEVSHRGELVYTAEELQASGWTVFATLGP